MKGKCLTAAAAFGERNLLPEPTSINFNSRRRMAFYVRDPSKAFPPSGPLFFLESQKAHIPPVNEARFNRDAAGDTDPQGSATPNRIGELWRNLF
jgi:hypothetical protein